GEPGGGGGVLARHGLARDAARAAAAGCVARLGALAARPRKGQPMRFWWRELTGWALVLLSLVVFFLCVWFLVGSPHYVLESGPRAFSGFIVFRGGIQRLKVAVAARICTQEAEPASAPRPGAGRPAAQRPTAVRRATR